MQTYDPKMAQRVWDRVHSTQQPPDLVPALIAMISSEWNDATTYLHLSRQIDRRRSNLLHRLFEEEQAHAACLRGIYTLLTGERANVKAVPPPQEPLAVTLRRCYGREMQGLARYEQWASLPEYGPVFSRMAEQEKEHCRILLTLLGNV